MDLQSGDAHMVPARAWKMRFAMPSQDTNSGNRDRLGFADAVREHIAPVLTAQGFTCCEAGPYMARFTSATITLAVSRDPVSYEIEVTFARKADPSRRCNLRDMLELASAPGRKDGAFFQASQPERVIECVRTIAGLLREYGKTVLAGEPTAFDRMAEISRLRNEAYTKEVVQKPIRKRAEEAWRNHDYLTVLDLYASIEADLTPIEKKRLEYAESHSAGNQAHRPNC